MRRLGLLVALAGLALPFPAQANHISSLDEMPVACGGGHPISTSPSADCIPSIDEPIFDDGSWLDDEDRVIGVAVGGDARAYPARILNWHEIVNDEIGGTPVAVTYCPLCGTGIVFDRRVGLDLLEFGVSGRLFHNDLVMYDRESESLWPQVLGEAVWGPLHGKSLDIVASSTTTWGEWEAEHAESLVLARPADRSESTYDRYPYGDYEDDEGTLYPRAHDDDRLHAKAWVYGVARGDAAMAFVVDELERRAPVLVDMDGAQLVVGWHAGAPVSWWAGKHRFSVAGDGLVEEHGRSWNASNGQGPDDARLERAPGVAAFWFAWLDFHPNTALWPGDTVAGGAPPGDAGAAGTPGLGALAIGLVVLALAPVAAYLKWRR